VEQISAPGAGLLARHRYAILFFSLLATVAIGPLLEALRFGRTAMEALLTLSLLAAVFPTRIGAASRRRVLFAFAAVTLLVRWGDSHLGSDAVFLAGAMLWSGVAVVAAYGAIRYSLSSVRIEAEHAYAGLAAYLLIGVCWGVVYVAVSRMQPGAVLVGGTPMAHGLGMGDAIYFSFVTLATLGYGDISPATPVMRGLSVFEAIIGQLYLAILVARLVSLRVAAQSSSG
jgi:hypothetical protein